MVAIIPLPRYPIGHGPADQPHLSDSPVEDPSTDVAPLPLSIFSGGSPAVAAGVEFERFQLDPCCWVDSVHGFIQGADSLFDDLADTLPWSQGQRLMYGKFYDEPRLTSRLALDDDSVPDVVKAAVAYLEGYYDRQFEGLFCNFYRNGTDSVAWHRDNIGKVEVDPLVAIISLGGPRTFSMRSHRDDQTNLRSEPTVRWRLESGDLLVMGGATQHHWEHAIHKESEAPPRISLTTRARLTARSEADRPL